MGTGMQVPRGNGVNPRDLCAATSPAPHTSRVWTKWPECHRAGDRSV